MLYISLENKVTLITVYTDDVDIACLNQAEYYWTLCGSNPAYPVTATYRPTTVYKIFP